MSEPTRSSRLWGSGEDVFEQRRVRHIIAVLIRNVTIPANNLGSSSTATLVRPKPTRSFSTASVSSASTIRRAPSVKSLRSRSRGRASSISSTSHNNNIDNTIIAEDGLTLDDTDLLELRQAVEARLCRTFLTLSRVEDGKELFRSEASAQPGVNFEWGRYPGSEIAPNGLLLKGIETEIGVSERIQVTIWYRQENFNDKGKGRDYERSSYVESGTEAKEGWFILLQQDLYLQLLRKVAAEAASSRLYHVPNTLILGLASTLADVQPDEKSSTDEDTRRIEAGASVFRQESKSEIRKGQQVYYLLSTDRIDLQPTSQEAIVTESAGEDGATIRAKLKNGELVRSYEIDDVLRLLQMQRELCQTIFEASAAEDRSTSDLESETGPVAKDLLYAERKERLLSIRLERDEVRESIKAKRKIVQERLEAINRRKARLEIARRTSAREQSEYHNLQRKLVQLDRLCAMVRAKGYARRVQLLRDLEFIYPIELVDGVSLLFSIVGVPLANRNNEEDGGRHSAGEDDDIASSALGLISQVVSLMSIYLDAPVHYPVATAGSRSVIQDSISVMSGPRTFPLYAKGVEEYRFVYAVFLLNKDIEHLMNNFGITVLDIRNTLPNLKNLLVTLSASPQSDSRLSRRNMIGSEMISLKGGTRLDQAALAVANGVPRPVGSVEESATTTEKRKKTAASSAWGMSLLGWGQSKELSPQSAISPSSAPATPISHPVPTTRSLGSQ